MQVPAGFGCYVANIGVKDDTDDFVVITAERPVAAAGVFTRSRFAGPSVTLSREHLADLWPNAQIGPDKLLVQGDGKAEAIATMYSWPSGSAKGTSGQETTRSGNGYAPTRPHSTLST